MAMPILVGAIGSTIASGTKDSKTSIQYCGRIVAGDPTSGAAAGVLNSSIEITSERGQPSLPGLLSNCRLPRTDVLGYSHAVPSGLDTDSNGRRVERHRFLCPDRFLHSESC